MYFSNFSGLTLQEAIDLAYEEDDNFFKPPYSHFLTVEDSDDEGGNPDNLNTRQLLAGGEVEFADSEHLGVVQSDLEASYDDNEMQYVNSSNQIKTDW